VFALVALRDVPKVIGDAEPVERPAPGEPALKK
jgi:hypothetical protein